VATENASISYQYVDVFEGDDHDEAHQFHESSKLTRRNAQMLSRRVDSIQRDENLQRMMWAAWKSYEGAPRIPLPSPSLGTMSVEDAFSQRRSQVGRFAGGPINVDALASLLRYTYGPTLAVMSDRFETGELLLRATPSAGGLYPLEIYPLVFDVEGCAPGIYHYDVRNHALEQLRAGLTRDDFYPCTNYRAFAETSSVVLAVTAVMRRTLSKYLFRGYRFVSYDVGCLLQSMYLSATALGVGACALGGFFDDLVGNLLDIDNVDENVMMCFALGQR
jgi:SagB-type dehydrogenase family enzyme